MAKETKVVALTVGDKGRVTLTEDVRKHLNIAAGDVVLVQLNEQGTVELIPAALVPRDQLWFAHPDMQSRIAEAHADIVAMRSSIETSGTSSPAAAAVPASAYAP